VTLYPAGETISRFTLEYERAEYTPVIFRKNMELVISGKNDRPLGFGIDDTATARGIVP
jgi:hypothetical protein